MKTLVERLNESLVSNVRIGQKAIGKSNEKYISRILAQNDKSSFIKIINSFHLDVIDKRLAFKIADRFIKSSNLSLFYDNTDYEDDLDFKMFYVKSVQLHTSKNKAIDDHIYYQMMVIQKEGIFVLADMPEFKHIYDALDQEFVNHQDLYQHYFDNKIYDSKEEDTYKIRAYFWKDSKHALDPEHF